MPPRPLLILLLACATLLPAAETTLFRQTFEEAAEVAASSHQTAGRFILADGGYLSAKALLADKPDVSGHLETRFTIPVPETSRRQVMRLTAWVKTLEAAPFSDYFFMVSQQKGGKSLGPNLFFAFNDGISRQSDFGGQFKAPQTLEIWKQTTHLFKLHDDAEQLILTLVSRGGSHRLLFDDIRLDDVGPESPPELAPVIYSATIDWPYATVRLDDIVPGAVYRIDAAVTRPREGQVSQLTPNARKSPRIAPAGMTGMGIAMLAYGLHDQLVAKEQLVELNDTPDARTYRLVIPDRAVRVELDLHNTDLVRYDHNQLEAQARRWDRFTVTLDNYGEITRDNAFYQYLYRNSPEHLKPRQVITPDPLRRAALIEHLARRRPDALELVKHQGGMCFKLNNTLVPPMLASFNSGQENTLWAETLARHGLRLFFARTPYGGVTLNGSWKGPGDYDFTALDNNVYNLLSQAPDATVILSIDGVYPPDWWAAENRDELMRTQEGLFLWDWGYHLYRIRFGTFEELQQQASTALSQPDMHLIRGATATGHFVPAKFSRRYAEDTCAYLAALRRYVERQPYGKAVAGYRIVWGHDGQLSPPRESYGHDGPAHVYDFSPATIAAFRCWLTARYGSDAALRQAWRDPGISLASAMVPPLEARNVDQADNTEYLLDPQESRQAVDYRLFDAEGTADLMLAFYGALKQAGRKKVVTMSYWPDLLEASSGGYNSNKGSAKAYADPRLDAVGGPSYDAREIGQAGRTNVLLGSTVLNGKIHLAELDHRLYTTVKRNYANNLLFDSARRTVSVLRREYARQICSGNGAWLFDMGQGWYDEELVGEIIGQCHDIFTRVLAHDRSSLAGMAMFFSEYGKTVQADARRGAIPKSLTANWVIASGHAGVPVDHFQMSDLARVSGRYKVYFFPFAYGLSASEADAINRLKRDGNILVFGCAAGYVQQTRDVAQVAALTGMQMATDPALKIFNLQFKENPSPLVRDLAGHFMGGNDSGYAAGLPKIHVSDPDAEKLAHFTGTSLCGFARKDFPEWTSIYIGSTGPVSPALLRNIAAAAGLHVYNRSGDVLFGNRSLIALHAASSGEKTISLPAPARVISLWDNRELGVLSEIVRPMRTGDNAFYLLQKP